MCVSDCVWHFKRQNNFNFASPLHTCHWCLMMFGMESKIVSKGAYKCLLLTDYSTCIALCHFHSHAWPQGRNHSYTWFIATWFSFVVCPNVTGFNDKVPLNECPNFKWRRLVYVPNYIILILCVLYSSFWTSWNLTYMSGPASTNTTYSDTVIAAVWDGRKFGVGITSLGHLLHLGLYYYYAAPVAWEWVHIIKVQNEQAKCI